MWWLYFKGLFLGCGDNTLSCDFALPLHDTINLIAHVVSSPLSLSTYKGYGGRGGGDMKG